MTPEILALIQSLKYNLDALVQQLDDLSIEILNVRDRLDIIADLKHRLDFFDGLPGR